MTRKRLLSLVKITLTLLVLGFSIYFSVWNVNFDDLGHSFATANYWYTLAVLPVIYFSHFLRAHRWKVMLETVDPSVRMGNLFSGVIVGYFMNNIIPRSGELARPYVTAQREENSTFSSLLGSIVIERFIDTIALLIIVAGILLFDKKLFEGFEEYGMTQTTFRNLLYPAIIIGVAFILVAPSKLGFRLGKLFAKPLPASLQGKVLDIFVNLQKGFGSIRTAKQIGIVLIETLAIYVCYMLPLYIMFFAFPSAATTDPTMVAAVKVLALTALAFAFAPTPGAFGVFHVTARIAVMKILAFTTADAVAYATITHFVNYMSVMALGGYFLVKHNLSFKELAGAKSDL